MSLTDWQHRWIDCALRLGHGDDWLTAHWVFARKVLGEPRRDAMEIAAAFRGSPLDRATCIHIAEGWAEHVTPTDDGSLR